MPQSLINEFVDLMRKVQLLADVAGRKRMSIELEEQGITREIQEESLNAKVNGTQGTSAGI